MHDASTEIEQYTAQFRFAVRSFLLKLEATIPAEKKNLTVEAISANGLPASQEISRIAWHPAGKKVTYLRSDPAPQGSKRLHAFELESKQETLVLDLSSAEEKYDMDSYQWSPQGDAVLLTGANDLWLTDPTQGEKKRLTNSPVLEEFPTFSPSGEYVAYFYKGNLFAIKLRTGKTQQLTFDGNEIILNGRLDWVYEEELANRRSGQAYQWSPDSRKIAYLRLDQTPVPTYPITDYLSLHPPVTPQRYPKAGDPNSIPSVHVVLVGDGKPKRYDCPLFPKSEEGKKGAEAFRKFEYVAPDLTWTPDSREAVLLTLNRPQTELTVHFWNVEQKKSRVVLMEKDPFWINSLEPPRFLKDGSFLWLSERSGWMHLYSYNARGELERQLTKGEWIVDESFEIDEKAGWVYYVANETDQRERQLYYVSLDGAKKGKLTQEAGTHTFKLSPGGQFLLNTFSDCNHPSSTRFLRPDGSPYHLLYIAEDHLKDYHQAVTELHEFKGAGGERFFGCLAKPADFDPHQKYPVVISVYGGPHAQVVQNRWGLTSGFDHLLAQEGFLLWSMDNRGSWGRGHAWETAVHMNLGKKELEDQLAGVAYLKSLPFVDGSRIGIWGGSYGGYMTLYALTQAPETFQCGISQFPVTDWKFYDSIYTERYMSTPKDNPEGYKAASPLEAAKQLKSSLLLVHGTSDDNVHMQNSMMFMDALIRARLPFELQIYPAQKHGVRGEAPRYHLYDRMLRFFMQNLQEERPAKKKNAE